jgi:DNA polymerase III gamma/tau subunit
MIAGLSDKSARNSLQNLQTVVAYAGGDPITTEHVEKALSAVDDVIYFRFIQNILEFNAPEAIKTLNNIFSKTGNARTIIFGLLNHLRHLQLYMILKDGVKDLDVSDENLKRFAYQAQKCKPSLVVKMIHFIVEVQKGLYVNMDAISMLENLFIVPSIIEAVKMKKEEEAKKIQ